jgi:hypothetical protein
MSLFACPDCNQQVSSTAKTCPHCGVDVKKIARQNDKMLRRAIIQVVLWATFFAVCLGLLNVFFWLWPIRR